MIYKLMFVARAGHYDGGMTSQVIEFNTYADAEFAYSQITQAMCTDRFCDSTVIRLYDKEA